MWDVVQAASGTESGDYGAPSYNECVTCFSLKINCFQTENYSRFFAPCVYSLFLIQRKVIAVNIVLNMFVITLGPKSEFHLVLLRQPA